MWFEESMKKQFGSVPKASESNIYLPSNIFEIINKGEYVRGNHKLFAISYYFMVSWVYRYCKYDDIYITTQSVSGSLKHLLGISYSTRTLDYLTKKDGVLEKIGLLKTIHLLDTPFAHKYDSYTDYITFDNFRDEDYKKRYPPHALAKEPLLGTREREYDGITYLGAFQDIEFTFCFTIKDYMYLKEVLKFKFDIIGFYLYLKNKSALYGNSIRMSRKAMSDELGINEKTITHYKKVLIENKLITELDNDGKRTRKNNTIKIKEVSDLYGSSEDN